MSLIFGKWLVCINCCYFNKFHKLVYMTKIFIKLNVQTISAIKELPRLYDKESVYLFLIHFHRPWQLMTSSVRRKRPRLEV